MVSPVTVTRIQNRRGTQAEFDALYPAGYNGVGGYDSPFNTSSITSGSYTTISGSGSSALIQVTLDITGGSFASGSSITVTGVTPSAYNGTFVVYSSTPTTVVYRYTGTAPTGVVSVPGIVYPAYTPTLFSNVLMPGELAVCTDTRNIFMGNLDGEYVQVATKDTGDALPPVIIALAPAASYSSTTLVYSATPFYTVLYSLTNSTSTENPNSVGTTFSRNGSLTITANASTATLNDVFTEVNGTSYTASFIAEYSGPNIIIKYKHNFPTNLVFSTNSIHWVSL